MALLEDLKSVVFGIPAELQDKKGVYSFETVIAERKAFLSRKKLIF